MPVSARKDSCSYWILYFVVKKICDFDAVNPIASLFGCLWYLFGSYRSVSCPKRVAVGGSA